MGERPSIPSNRDCLKQICEITPAVHDADIDLTLVSVGVHFKKNEIWPFDQHAHGRPNFRASPPEPRKVPKRICLGFDRSIKAFCSCRIIEPDDDIDIEQVPPSLGTLDHLIPLCFLGFCEPLLRLLSQLLEIKRLRRAAGLALIPKMPEAFDVFLTKLTFELPVANGFADDFACGCIFSGFNRGLQDGELLSGHGNTDFLDVRHDPP